jgi:sulfide:quinone oxidoreductase
MLKRTITAIDPEKRRVTTDDGVFDADYLVVALGADYDFGATPGLSETNEFYSVAGAERLRDVLPADVPEGQGDGRRLRGTLQMSAGTQRMR